MAKLERWLDFVEERRHEDAAFARLRRLVGHPLRADRVVRPDDNRAHRAFKGLLNHAVVALAEGDIAVPPDVEAVRLQGLDERLYPGAIGSRVAQKDGAHLGLSVRYYESARQESMHTVPPAADVHLRFARRSRVR